MNLPVLVYKPGNENLSNSSTVNVIIQLTEKELEELRGISGIKTLNKVLGRPNGGIRIRLKIDLINWVIIDYGHSYIDYYQALYPNAEYLTYSEFYKKYYKFEVEIDKIKII